MKPSKPQIETLALHAGQKPDPTTAARTRHIVKPKIMAPPVLRMPTFTAPAPFCPSEAGKPKEAPAQEIEKPAPPKEEKKEKGILAKIKKLF